MRGWTSMLGGVLAAGVLAAGGCVWSSPLFERDFRVQAAHETLGPVDVKTDNGRIDITKGAAGEVVIDATVRARTQERADATTVTAEHSPDGVLLVRVQWPEGGRQNNEGCSMRIVLPGAEGVTAATSNGHIVISDLSGRAELQTSNGRVEVVRHAGEVRAKSSNGRIVVSEAGGDIETETTNGGITVVGARGVVVADTSNGDIEITLGPASAGPVRADTSNGSIDLTVGKAFSGRLRADTSNGRVRVNGADPSTIKNQSKTSADMTFGSEGAESSLRTSNGSIHVEREG